MTGDDFYRSVQLTKEELEAAILEGQKKKWFHERAKENGMICAQCNEFRPLEKNGICGTCNASNRKAAKVKPAENNAPIAKRSMKTAEIERRYLNRLKTWKRGKKCSATFKHECDQHNGIECHHMKGRGTYFYDTTAEEKGIPLTLDERFWVPLCHNSHGMITTNSRFALENGYSESRLI